MRKHVVVDLDGTLADIGRRRRFIKGRRKDWKAFHEACIDDPANDWCVRLIQAMRAAGHGIQLVSARSREVEGLTRKWLERVFGPAAAELELSLVRGKGDFRHDVELKRAWLRRFGAENVLFAVDDRGRVVRMWREEGVVCLQCDDWEERESAEQVAVRSRAAEDRP